MVFGWKTKQETLRLALRVIARDVVIVPVDSGLSRTIYSAPDDRPRAEYCQYSVDGETVYCKSRDPQGRALISLLDVPMSCSDTSIDGRDGWSVDLPHP